MFVERAERGLILLQSEGRADPTLDAHVAASALGGMVENFARSWFLHGEVFDREVAIATLTRLWAQAIGLTDSMVRISAGIEDPLDLIDDLKQALA